MLLINHVRKFPNFLKGQLLRPHAIKTSQICTETYILFSAYPSMLMLMFLSLYYISSVKYSWSKTTQQRSIFSMPVWTLVGTIMFERNLHSSGSGMAIVFLDHVQEHTFHLSSNDPLTIIFCCSSPL